MTSHERPQAAAMVPSGQASAIRAGRNPTREWVSVPLPPGGQTVRWRELLGDACDYARPQTAGR